MIRWEQGRVVFGQILQQKILPSGMEPSHSDRVWRGQSSGKEFWKNVEETVAATSA